jgi:hypothetical protein
MYNSIVIPGLQHWQLLSKQTDIGQSRTSALNPLQWTLAILLLGLLILLWTGADKWIIVGLGVCVFGDVGLLAFGYFYFMFKNPDALRSEAFSLQKMAIERGLVGDSLHEDITPTVGWSMHTRRR